MANLRRAVLWLTLCAVSPAAASPVDRWATPIAEASARFGIPEDWIRRVMTVESGGRTVLGRQPIRSTAGAMGLMQLMPATWREMREAHRLGFDPDDPRDNILAGTAYLRSMYERFGYPGLFAAYNAGPARYARHLATGSRLPLETEHYVAAVARGGLRAGPTPVPLLAARGAARPTLFARLGADVSVAQEEDSATARSEAEGLFFRLSSSPDSAGRTPAAAPDFRTPGRLISSPVAEATGLARIGSPPGHRPPMERRSPIAGERVIQSRIDRSPGRLFRAE